MPGTRPDDCDLEQAVAWVGTQGDRHVELQLCEVDDQHADAVGHELLAVEFDVEVRCGGHQVRDRRDPVGGCTDVGLHRLGALDDRSVVAGARQNREAAFRDAVAHAAREFEFAEVEVGDAALEGGLGEMTRLYGHADVLCEQVGRSGGVDEHGHAAVAHRVADRRRGAVSACRDHTVEVHGVVYEVAEHPVAVAEAHRYLGATAAQNADEVV